MTVHDQHAESHRPVAPPPHQRLHNLDVLEGAWQLEGHDLDGGSLFSGTVTRRWAPGGYFLVQRMRIDGEDEEGAEYIGYDYARDELRSMFFSAEGPGPFCSFALEYVWQVQGDSLTIWHGERDSPARFLGTIDPTGDIIDGRWEWPGGGYHATSRRLPDD